MATLAASAVTVNDTWKGLGTNSRKYLFKDVTLALTGHGGLTNTILASLFGMTKILGVLDARDSNSVQMSASPSYDGTSLVFYLQNIPAVKSYLVTGTNATGDITASGVVTGDTIAAVQNIGGATAYAVASLLSTAQFSITAADTIHQATGADLSAKKLLILTQSPTAVADGTPTDITATVRCTVFGNDS